MCGRYNFTARPEDVADHFRLIEAPDLRPRYNIAPTQEVPVVALHGERFRLGKLKWGLVPDWADSPEPKVRPFNARDDSMGKPMFARLFASQRCLLPATGFYEWRTTGRRKEPVHFFRTDGGLLALAGLWSVWTDGTRKVGTCCLITTGPNELVKDYHDRMPVIIPPDQYRAWLSNDTPERELKAMLRPFPAGVMTARLANPIMNKSTVEGPECLTPPADQPPGLTSLRG